jgi:hypothetical protein
VSASNDTQYIQIVLNGAIVQMGSGSGQVCVHSTNGRYALTDFIDFQQKHALEAANFNKMCSAVNRTGFTIPEPSFTNGTLYCTISVTSFPLPFHTLL